MVMGFFWKNGIGLEGTQPIFGGGFWWLGLGVFGCVVFKIESRDFFCGLL